MKIKRILSLIMAGAMFVSLNTVFALSDEQEAIDGTISACRADEIYVNEDFSEGQLPSGDTENKLATWKFSGVGASIEDESLYLQGGVKSYGQVKLNTPLTGVGNKYVFSCDISRVTCNANFYSPTINGKKPIAFYGSGASYFISTIDDANVATKVATNISADTDVNIKLIIEIGESEILADVTISDLQGNILGSAENQKLAGYSADIQGIDTFVFGYTTDDIKVDNLQIYPYKNATVANPTITEIPVNGIPEMAEGTSLLIDENFDAFPGSISAASYTGADSSIWRLEGNSLNGETKILSSGRKVLKLSADAGLLAGVTPTEKLVYSDSEDAKNKYVLQFGMRPKATDNSFLLAIKNADGEIINILTSDSDGVMTVGEEEFTLLDKWYSVAVTYELKSGSTAINVALTDGIETRSFNRIVISESNSIDEFIWQTGNDGIIYLDNVSLYKAVYIPPKKPEARNMSVTGVCYNGRTLTGYYEYYDANQEERGEDEYYWVRSDKAEPADGEYEKISDTEKSLTYTLQPEDIGKYVFFAVQPKKADGCEAAIGDITYKMAETKVEDEPAVLDVNWLINKNLGAADLKNVTSDLVLNINGENGCKIKWSSDNENVIGTDGTVKRQARDVIVNLTAEVTSPDEFVTKEHNFEVTVKAIAIVTGGGSGGGGGGRGSATNVKKGSSAVSMPVEMYSENKNVPLERPKHLYNDVADKHWAMDYIQELYHRNIATGDENNNFAPENNIKREEFTKMIVCAFNLLDDTAFVEFDDVDKAEWYYPYVASAYKSLIISGVGNDKFGISENITRQDVAVIAYRILKSEGIGLNGENAEEFADCGEIASYAKEAVSVMKKTGIMNGSGNNMFCPQNYATRAEVAKILVDLLKFTGK